MLRVLYWQHLLVFTHCGDCSFFSFFLQFRLLLLTSATVPRRKAYLLPLFSLKWFLIFIVVIREHDDVVSIVNLMQGIPNFRKVFCILVQPWIFKTKLVLYFVKTCILKFSFHTKPSSQLSVNTYQSKTLVLARKRKRMW